MSTSARMARGPPHGDHDAELRAPEGPGVAGELDQLGGREHRLAGDVGGVARRLGAEGAVLGTPAGLGRDDGLDLHRRAHPAEADLVGEPDQLGQLVVTGQDEPLGELAADVASLLDEEVGGGFHGGGQRGHGPEDTGAYAGNVTKRRSAGGLRSNGPKLAP